MILQYRVMVEEIRDDATDLDKAFDYESMILKKVNQVICRMLVT